MIELTPSMDSFRKSKSHYFARLWHIQRADGTNFYFTDFQYSIEYDSNTYQPISVIDASAIQRREGLAERNRSAIGYLTSTEFTEDDLRAGLFNDAQVFEHQVDWRYPWQGFFAFNTYYITEIKWTGETWEAELDMLTTRLRQFKGITVSRRCRFKLGDSDCTIDTSAYTESSSVSSIITQRRVIQTGLTVQPDGYYNEGLLTFTSGDNNGSAYTVHSSTQTGGVLTFITPTKYDIASNDTFTIYPGCNHTENHCKGDDNRPWDTNFSNFGGFLHSPGTTNALTTPNAK